MDMFSNWTPGKA